jgi:uncharacterized membrane protein YccC
MSRITDLIGDIRPLLGGIVRDFKWPPESGRRTIDEIESVLSVLLAITFAHLLDAKNVGWAAFSGYMVMRSHVSESFTRGCLRVVGTATGAMLAWLLAAHLSGAPVGLGIALALVGAVTLYMALLDRHSYAWLFAGLTFAMVLIDGMEHPHQALGVFARTRFIEVFAGTAAAVIVSAVSTVTVRRMQPGPQQRAKAPTSVRVLPPWNKAVLRHVAQAAIAFALIPWAWAWLGIASLSQSSVTILAVMMVPIANLSAGAHPTTTKILHRLIGCSVGGLLATVILLLLHPWPVLLLIAVCFGVVIGRHLENGKLGVGYIGTQFALAFLVVLVPDSYASIDIGPGFDRLFGILFGMVLLEPVRLVFRYFVPLPDEMTPAVPAEKK